MGFFGRRSTTKKDKKKQQKEAKEAKEAAPRTARTARTTTASNRQNNNNNNNNAVTTTKQQPSAAAAAAAVATTTTTDPTLEHIPQLLQDISDDDDDTGTGGDKPARALRMLFSLSEHASNGNRTHMVLVTKRLVPTLLQFLQDCTCGSSEQYLALLVLNNISIPSPNKRTIALQYGGAKILARLLCDDPSCHLMAIILVNLTFCDAELRRDLADPSCAVIDSLAYALKLSSMTESEFETVESLDDGDDVKEKLQSLLLHDLQLRPATSDLDFTQNARSKDLLLSPHDLCHAETARWCLAALKNLTRPGTTSSSPVAACTTLQESGILTLILRLITTIPPIPPELQEVSSVVTDTAFLNATVQWEANSMQDAALFCVLNLTATPESRAIVIQSDGVQLLSMIADYHATDISVDEANQMEFQSLKARMALSYLLGSSGHFGQARGTNTTATFASAEDSVLLLSEPEAAVMVELLANTLANRAKEGPGGYSAATFHVKWVLYSIRCLLTHSLNQQLFATTMGPRLNALLMKALAEHSMKTTSAVDQEAAEYAAFSLYLQSNYGFKDRFLPAVYGNQDNIKGTGSLAAKVLTSYIHMESITPAGRHAADQLLLRLRYLDFKGSVSELAQQPLLMESDFSFDEELRKHAETILVEKRSHGSRPHDDVFDRPILRSRGPKKGHSSRAPWEKRSVRVFPSALLAVQELSFGSSRVRHMDAIDDIMVANNIANSANGDKTESYNYLWSWQDATVEIQKNIESGDSFLCASGGAAKQSRQPEGPMSIFGLTCGSMACTTDTTKDT